MPRKKILKKKEILVDPAVPGSNEEDQLNHGKGMFQQSAEINMMDGLGSGCQLEFSYKLLIPEEGIQKLALRLTHAGGDGPQFGKHIFDVARRLRQKVIQPNFCLLTFSQSEDAQLKHPLKFFYLPLHLDKIILIE